MYAHKPTSESLNPAASLTNVPFGILSLRDFWTVDSRTAVPGQRHRYSHFNPGDSKSLPNNRTAKVRTFFLSHAPLQFEKQIFYDYLTIYFNAFSISVLIRSTPGKPMCLKVCWPWVS